VVNVHHLADQIEDHLKHQIADGSVIISDERHELLETGGGTRRALKYLCKDPFFSINSDALWLDGTKPTLKGMAEAFDPALMDVLLLMVPTEEATGYDGQGDFFVEETSEEPNVGPLEFRGDRETAPFMYGGIMISKPDLYQEEPEGSWSNLVIFRKALARGRLYGLVHQGLWMHVGTPEGIDAAEKILTSQNQAQGAQ
jgi:MurNAc alpha-1-phosphate uridylyltransferase